MKIPGGHFDRRWDLHQNWSTQTWTFRYLQTPSLRHRPPYTQLRVLPMHKTMQAVDTDHTVRIVHTEHWWAPSTWAWLLPRWCFGESAERGTGNGCDANRWDYPSQGRYQSDKEGSQTTSVLHADESMVENSAHRCARKYLWSNLEVVRESILKCSSICSEQAHMQWVYRTCSADVLYMYHICI